MQDLGFDIEEEDTRAHTPPYDGPGISKKRVGDDTGRSRSVGTHGSSSVSQKERNDAAVSDLFAAVAGLGKSMDSFNLQLDNSHGENPQGREGDDGDGESCTEEIASSSDEDEEDEELGGEGGVMKQVTYLTKEPWLQKMFSCTAQDDLFSILHSDTFSLKGKKLEVLEELGKGSQVTEL